MSKNRDPLAPTQLRDDQLEAISRKPRIMQLRKERNELKNEMRSSARTIEAAKTSHPDLYSKHREVCKKLARVRKAFHREAQIKTREEYYEVMPMMEVDKQLDQLLSNSNTDPLDSEDEDGEWNPPVPEYAFSERSRIVEAFYGLDAEILDSDEGLAKRVEVTKDLTALCELREPSRRGKPFNWNREENHDIPAQRVTSADGLKCPTDICIICFGDRSLGSSHEPRKYRRIDSLRRHLIHLHLNQAGGDIRCPLDACKDLQSFSNVITFLRHTATIHDYDLGISRHHIS